jgi:hypothetical protein
MQAGGAAIADLAAFGLWRVFLNGGGGQYCHKSSDNQDGAAGYRSSFGRRPYVRVNSKV